ncbi:MAG: WYL domain-containing protein [Actinomycetota bacterium]
MTILGPDDSADPVGRVLQLLALLQTARRRTSAELADELGVTTRTVRRDIDRLRLLGYPVDSEPGRDGGYRLGVGGHLPPLMLDDDEAVAIAVGLWSATTAPVSGIADTSVRALSKLQALLPDRLRRRLSSLTDTVSTYRWHDHECTTDIDVLAGVASGCRDREEIRFRYVDKSANASDRLVEPHRLVAIDARWYLLAWDLRRSDWRTFRVDRITDVLATGARFSPRPVPGGDPAAYVAGRLGAATESTATVTVSVSIEELHAWAPWYTDRVADSTPTSVTLHLTSSDPTVIAAHIAELATVAEVDLDEDVDSDVIEIVRRSAERLAAI